MYIPTEVLGIYASCDSENCTNKHALDVNGRAPWKLFKEWKRAKSLGWISRRVAKNSLIATVLKERVRLDDIRERVVFSASGFVIFCPTHAPDYVKAERLVNSLMS